MRQMKTRTTIKIWPVFAVSALFTASLAFAVTPNARTFTAGQESKVQGVIISRDGSIIKLRADDDSIGTIDLTDTTKIQLKSGIFKHKTAMNLDSLVPGLHVEAAGKGNEKGELVAARITFDPNSMRASKQIDTRVSPLEARTGTLEGRAGSLEGRATQIEGRATQIEGRQGQLEDAQHQLGDKVGQVKSDADRANAGVGDVNRRVGDIDNYAVKESATVYFKLNSSVLTPEAKKDLDDLSKKALSEKGYMVEIQGFADATGNASKNQLLSEARATSVIRYLEEEGNIPVRRILAPAGMGTTHEAADNSTAQGRKMNRRVEVKVLVSQGLVSGTPADASMKTPEAPHQ